MCGACGSGTVRAPWEVRAHGGSPRDLAARAAQAQQLLGRRATVTPFGPAGFTLRTPTGRTTVHRDLDDLVTGMLDLAADRVEQHARRELDPVAGRGSLVARAVVARLEAR